MSFILITSIVIRLVAMGWSIVPLRRTKDWRMGFLTVMLGLMATRQILTLTTEKSGVFSLTGPWAVELPGLVVSIMAFITVFFLDRMLTERKQIDKAMRESEERFRSVVENSHDGILILDDAHKLIYVNDELTRILGYSREEIVGQDFRRFLDKESEQLVADRYVRRQRGEDVPPRYEFNIVRKDGEKRQVEISASVIKDSTGKVQTVAQILDITERKQAEKALKKSEEQLRNVLDGLGPYMLVGLMTPDGTLIEANKPALEIAGLKPEDVLGKPFEETYWWSYSESVKQRLRDAIRRAARGETCRYDEIVRVDENRFITIDFCLHPLVDEAGRIIYLVPSAVDITERKQAEEELRKYRKHLEELIKERTSELEEKTIELEEANIRLQELDRLKSMFIASMSHELRTPLNSIIGFTGILLKGMAGKLNEEQKKQLNMVYSSAKHLLALINDIIDLSKIEAGKIELAIEEFDLSSLVQEVKDSFMVAAEEKGLKISLKMAERVIIKSDRRRVKQILMNLVGNAIKFTDKGKIEIKVTKKDEMVEVAVRDTGIGIRKGDMKKLFKPFSQIYLEGRSKEGTGLGLYLSKKIADLLGGEIKAESEFGKGSVFTFTLPLKYKEAKT